MDSSPKTRQAKTRQAEMSPNPDDVSWSVSPPIPPLTPKTRQERVLGSVGDAHEYSPRHVRTRHSSSGEGDVTRSGMRQRASDPPGKARKDRPETVFQHGNGGQWPAAPHCLRASLAFSPENSARQLRGEVAVHGRTRQTDSARDRRHARTLGTEAVDLAGGPLGACAADFFPHKSAPASPLGSSWADVATNGLVLASHKRKMDLRFCNNLDSVLSPLFARRKNLIYEALSDVVGSPCYHWLFRGVSRDYAFRPITHLCKSPTRSFSDTPRLTSTSNSRCSLFPGAGVA